MATETLGMTFQPLSGGGAGIAMFAEVDVQTNNIEIMKQFSKFINDSHHFSPEISDIKYSNFKVFIESDSLEYDYQIRVSADIYYNLHDEAGIRYKEGTEYPDEILTTIPKSTMILNGVFQFSDNGGDPRFNVTPPPEIGIYYRGRLVKRLTNVDVDISYPYSLSFDEVSESSIYMDASLNLTQEKTFLDNDETSAHLFLSINEVNTSNPRGFNIAFNFDEEFNPGEKIIIRSYAEYQNFEDLLRFRCRLTVQVADGTEYHTGVQEFDGQIKTPKLTPGRIFVQSNWDNPIVINDTLFPIRTSVATLEIPLREAVLPEP